MRYGGRLNCAVCVLQLLCARTNLFLPPALRKSVIGIDMKKKYLIHIAKSHFFDQNHILQIALKKLSIVILRVKIILVFNKDVQNAYILNKPYFYKI